MKFKDLSIGTKLAIGFGIITVILLVLGIREVYIVNHLEENTNDVVQSTTIADNIMEAKFNLRTEQLIIMELIEQDEQSSLDDINKSRDAIHTVINENLSNAITICVKDDWGMEFDSFKHQLSDALNEIGKSYIKDVKPLIDQVYQLKMTQIESANDEATNQALHTQIEDLDSVVDDICSSLIGRLEALEVEVEDEMLDVIIAETISVQAASRLEVSITLFLALILALVLTVVITRIITRPLKEAVLMTARIAAGDLAVKSTIEQSDEVGRLVKFLEEMAEKLNEIVSNVISGTDNIASASIQLSTVSQQISQGASEQASSTEEVSASMEEMSSNIQQNTDNAQQTEHIALDASQGISDVKEAADDSLETIKKISEKITIVNDIAFQTNILALNAAVEAARAGEHGRGFAVVAAEVRKLADRSKVAADEILILSAQGVQTTERSSDLMNQMVPEIKKTATLVQEIAASSMEQKTGADQVNSAVNQLSQVTQQNAAASEEMATSSEEMSTQASQLRELIAFFRINSQVDRGNGSPNVHPTNGKSANEKIEPSKLAPKKGIEISINEPKEIVGEYESF